MPACLDITQLLDWSLQQNAEGVWVLEIVQELASPTCPGGATYSLHTLVGNSADTVQHSRPAGLGTNVLTYTVPVEPYEATCSQLGLVPVTRMAVKAYATTKRGSHGDSTGTKTFNNDPAACGPPGGAGWS